MSDLPAPDGSSAGAAAAPAAAEPAQPAAGDILAELEAVLRGRVHAAPQGSYSAGLVRDSERVARKVVEEAYELAVELQRPALERRRVVSESADLVFHVLAALVGAGVSVEEVLGELTRRREDSR